MKTIILIGILISSTIVQGQIKGIENYGYSPEWDSILLGDKKFVYPEYAPTHKQYWYAEGVTKEDYRKVIAEAERLLKINGSDLSKIVDVEDDEQVQFASRSLEDLWEEGLMNDQGIFVEYHLPDIHADVATYWLLTIVFSVDGVHLYIVNSYVLEYMDHAAILAQLK